MLEKKYIEVAEITHSRTVLARTYRPIVSKESYLKEICDEFDNDLGSWGIFAMMIEQEEVIVKAKERLGVNRK